jgi:hypothetical protein
LNSPFAAVEIELGRRAGRLYFSGLTFKAHRGEGAALLAFDVDPDLQDDLAGFAVRYLSPEGREWPITNHGMPIHERDRVPSPRRASRRHGRR